MIASRSPISVEPNGASGTKSISPAMVVLSPSTGNRLMRWMPDSPAVSFAQLSALPAPSEVTMPMPVTTTTGRPALSRWEDISVSFCRFDERHALAAPVPDPGDDDLLERTLHGAFDPRTVGGNSLP